MRDLKFKLKDPTLTSNVNQTLSNLLSQVNKTNTHVGALTRTVNNLNFSSPAYVPVLAAGSNISDLPWNTYNRGSGSVLATAGFTYCQAMFADSIIGTPPAKAFKVSINVSTVLSAPIVEFVVIRTLKGSLTTTDVAVITFGGSATPTFSSTGVHTSDAVSLVIDAEHDYYFCFSGNAFGGSGNIMSNDQSSQPAYTSYAGNTNNGGAKCSSTWSASVGAGGGFSAAFPLGFTAYFLCGWVAA